MTMRQRSGPTKESRGNGMRVGLVANPFSARDIRRVIANAASLQVTDRANIVLRVLACLGACGVSEVLAMPERAGIRAHVERGIERARNTGGERFAALRHLEFPVTGTVEDTRPRGPRDGRRGGGGHCGAGRRRYPPRGRDGLRADPHRLRLDRHQQRVPGPSGADGDRPRDRACGDGADPARDRLRPEQAPRRLHQRGRASPGPRRRGPRRGAGGGGARPVAPGVAPRALRDVRGPERHRALRDSRGSSTRWGGGSRRGSWWRSNRRQGTARRPPGTRRCASTCPSRRVGFVPSGCGAGAGCPPEPRAPPAFVRG